MPAKKKWPTGISPSGRGLRIRIWRKGKQVYTETIQCDPHRASDIKSIERHRNALQARLELGLPAVESEQSDTKLFSEIAQDFMDCLDVKRSTAMSYVNIINAAWMPAFRHLPVHEITTPMIKRALAKMEVTNKTKKNRLIPLRGILAHGEVNPNPALAIRLKRHQKAEVERYRPVEQDKLLAQLEGDYLLYFTLLFDCGFRPRGEVLALTWADYDGEQISINKIISRRRLQNSTKTSQPRKVYVPTRSRELLNNHPGRFEGGFIFKNSHGGPHLDTDLFNAAWKVAHRRARLPYRQPYTCRHTRAAELLSIGIDQADAANQLGHSAEMFGRIYAEYIEEYANKDLSRFEGHRQKTDKKTAGKLNTE